MRLFPAIDLQGGRCVRLRRGLFTDETVFSDDPVSMARHWVAEGARFLHVVDLDGARLGEPQNLDVVEAIASAVAVPVQMGGGVRSAAVLERLVRGPIARVIVGTSVVLDEEFLGVCIDVLGPRLVPAVDAEDGYVKTHGWQERSSITAVEAALALHRRGVREVLYTDISRDGMMASVGLEATRALAEATRVPPDSGVEPLQIIASGGVTTLGDLRVLRELEPLGVTAVVVGRALYEGRFTIGEARQALED